MPATQGPPSPALSFPYVTLRATVYGMHAFFSAKGTRGVLFALLRDTSPWKPAPAWAATPESEQAGKPPPVVTCAQAPMGVLSRWGSGSGPWTGRPTPPENC